MVTAYDAVTSALLEHAGVDLILVGDSLGMVVLGYDSTRPVTLEEMIHHAKAVRRGAARSLIIGDLPLKAVQNGPVQALANARRFARQGSLDAIKIEWRKDALKITQKLIRAGIPVMGHVGLTPQSAHREGGYGVRGRAAQDALRIYERAVAFERAGAFAVLMECVPEKIAAYITKRLTVPTIGIGAGAGCDGQVLVFHDIVGLFERFQPKFVRPYAQAGRILARSIGRFARDVRDKKFPAKKHAFSMPENEWRLFRERAAHAG